MHAKSKMWLTVLTVILMVGTLFAGSDVTRPDTSTLSQAPKKSVSEFLTPDGRFDFVAAQRAGFQGALDASGFGISLDPVDSVPFFKGNGTSAVAPTIRSGQTSSRVPSI